MTPFNLFTSMVLGLFFWLPSWLLASSARWFRSDISSLLSSSVPASTTRSKSRLRRFSECSLWAAFGLLGLALAGTGWLADGLSEDGWNLQNFSMVETASRLFPWNRFIRTKPGYFAMYYIRPGEASIEIIGTALRTDPFAADLTLGLAQHWAAVGSTEMAALIAAKFHHLAPNSKVSP